MKTIISLAFIVAGAAALAGCNPGADNAGAPDSKQVATPQVAKPAVADAVQPSPRTSDNGMLTVDPAVVDICARPDNVTAAKVSWDASSTGTEGIEIWLQSPGEARTLWLASGAVASEQTGPWLRGGSTVALVNGEDKQELARIVLEARGCSN